MRTKQDLVAAMKYWRQRGWEDGHAGRPAGTKEAHYQLGYRQGLEQRAKEARGDDAA